MARTSLVVKPYGENRGFRRACTPDDLAADGKPLAPDDGTTAAVLAIPWYTPTHTANGRAIIGGKARKSWTEKARVSAVSNGFPPERGKVQQIRHLGPDVVSGLDKIDAERAALKEQIAALNQREQMILANAYDTAAPIRVAEAQRWRDEIMAARMAAHPDKYAVCPTCHAVCATYMNSGGVRDNIVRYSSHSRPEGGAACPMIGLPVDKETRINEDAISAVAAVTGKPGNRTADRANRH